MKSGRWIRRFLWAGTILAAITLLLFVLNGVLADWETPEVTVFTEVEPAGRCSEIRILAFNIAKCFMYEGGLSFAEPSQVIDRLDRILEIIRRARPDLVFLSEAVIECAPCPVNQVEHLAKGGGFHCYAFGEEYNWGLPFLRIRSGNAILSRLPLEPIENIQLAGGKPFYDPSNNRRALWCTAVVNGKRLLVGGIRNDSFDIQNNLVQAHEIVTYLKERTALLAGDFNAEPHTAPMGVFRSLERFSARFDGPPTFPSWDPTRRIDYVLAPRSWRLLSEEVIATDVSDHLPVLAIFSLE